MSLPADAAVSPAQHWTQPPGRFNEGSLVRALEDLGIGRPSTYAMILSVLQERGYVHKEGRALVPDPIGRISAEFLKQYFPE